MESEQSRPFFNPEEGKPYDLREIPSGSEVSYGAEWGNHGLDGDGYCEVCDAYGLNCIEQGGNSPESIAVVEEAIGNLENSLQSLKDAGVTDMRELKSAIKQAKLKMYSMMNENRCTCDREYGEADPDCMACLNEWRNQRYGPDVHDVECVCNECVPLGGYSSYAESYEAESKPRLSEKQLWSLNVMKTSIYHGGEGSYAYVEVDNRGYKPFMSRPVQGLLNKGLIDIPRNKNPGFWGSVESYEAYIVFLTPLAWEYEYTYPFSAYQNNNNYIRQEGNKMVSDAETFDAEGKVRTMSGKPHTPRNLVKDKNITPKDASKKLKLEAKSTEEKRQLISELVCFKCGVKDEIANYNWNENAKGCCGMGVREKRYYANKSAESFEAESGQMCDVCFGNDDLPYDSDHFTKCGRCKKSVCMDCDGEMEYHPDWFKVCGECDTILENVSIHGADSFGVENETIVDEQETDGITTRTKQYKDKSYDIPEMRKSIPLNKRNQVDDDDGMHQLIGALKTVGVILGIVGLASGYNKYKNRN